MTNTQSQTTPQTPNPSPTPENLETSTAPKPDDSPILMPSPIINSPVKKPKNKLLPVVIVLSAFTLAGLGASIYFGIQNSNQASEIFNLKSQLNNQTPASTPQDQPSALPTPTAPDNNSSDSSSENISKENISKILAQVPKNLIIKSDIIYTTSASYKDASSLSMSYSWNFHDNSGDATIYWDTLATNFNYNKTGTERITNFGPTDGRVIDIIFGRFGNGSGYECFLFLMDDGTVEYVPYYLALKENNFYSRGKLTNVKDIIKFYNITNAHSQQAFSGYRTILAQRADGTIYDLASTINELNILLTD